MHQLLLIITTCVSLALLTAGQDDDGYTDENRPYKFGFNIQGYQHRKEEKDEKGIINGEYGFITADGYYRVTVYKTDEKGDFKIVSMKNYYVGFPPDDPTTTPVPQRVQNPILKSSVQQALSTTQRTTPNPLSQTTVNALYRATAPQTVTQQTTPSKGAVACSSCFLPTSPKPPQRPSDNATPKTRPNLLGPSSQPGVIPPVPKNSNPANYIGKSPLQPNRQNLGANLMGGQVFSPGNPSVGSQSKIPTIESNQGLKEFEKKFIRGPQAGLKEISNPNIRKDLKLEGLKDISTPNIHKDLKQQGLKDISTPNINKDLKQQGLKDISTPSINKGLKQQGLKDISTPHINKDLNQPGLTTPNTRNDLKQQILNQENYKLTNPKHELFQPISKNDDPQIKQQEITQNRQFISQEPQKLRPKNTNDLADDNKLLYRFNYTVGFHGHHEDGYRNGDKIGDYFVNSRDGKSRKVEYLANEFGYQPNITLTDIDIDDVSVPKEGSEKEFGLQGYEFKWFYPRR